LRRFGEFDARWRTTMGKKYKKIWDSKEEWEAHEAEVERNIQRLRALAEKAQRELDERKASGSATS
jgi:cytochrome c556